MPATEQTWRDQRLMHVIFAVTGALMLIATIWMLAADHSREWKPYQRTARAVDLQMTRWREQQYQTVELESLRAQLQARLLDERSKPVDEQLLERFEAAVSQDARRRQEETPAFTELERQQAELARRSSAAAKERQQLQTLLSKLDEAKQTITQIQTTLTQTQQQLQQQASPQAQQALETAQNQLKEWQAYRQKLEQEVAEARQRLESAERRAAEARAALVGYLQEEYLTDARFREDFWLGRRKFKAANLDAAKADLGLAVRDNREGELPQKQQEVDRLQAEFQDLTLRYQAASQHRRELQRLLGEMTAAESEAQKALEESEAELARLRESIAQQRATYVTWAGPNDWIPLPGKKILEMPILDAFNSPLEIQNLWTDGLTIDYNFANVRRFDRCTTCHTAIAKTMPGSATEPAYVKERLLQLTLFAPTQEELQAFQEEFEAIRLAAGQQEPESDREQSDALLGHLYGLHLADNGLLDRNDVTVSFVQPESPGARAVLLYDPETYQPRSGEQLQDLIMQPVSFPTEEMTEEESATTSEPRDGLLVGDVILKINGDLVRNRADAAFRLRQAAGTGEPLELEIRRGLPNPFTSHPRLDLFVGSMSPHDMTMFGCTVCHEGQGSATAFKWASHTPNTLLERQEWAQEHGWFENHHWIFPMYPTRFAQSSCLKCHHNVMELEPSERFPDPPAPKLMHGYDLILKYGCFGCHEVNGYAGDQTIGPDLRLEPNYSAAAQQVAYLLEEAITQHQQRLEQSSAEQEQTAELQQQLEAMLAVRTAATEFARNPDNNVLRSRLAELLSEGAAPAVSQPQPAQSQVAAMEQTSGQSPYQPVLPANVRDLAPLFEPSDQPGQLQKVGPSLRHVEHKLDPVFLYDWIRDPQHFRPSTRMPQFFGHYGHLKGEEGSQELAEQLEPVEVLGLVAYLRHYSQPFDYLTPPEEVSAADQARGKILFQERGCLACHSHKDFPEIEEFRTAKELVQGPDLSGVGDKFDAERNAQGPAWLYSWIRQPSRYHTRTLMPEVPLDSFETTDAQGNTITVDPAADIVAFLLEESHIDWEPMRQAQRSFNEQGEYTLDEPTSEALDQLALLHLGEAFYETLAERYLEKGIPADQRDELKGPELELVVPVEQFDDENFKLSTEQKLIYIGNRTVAKYGCYGCHDVPGFEAAKPIGTTLSDWGRKEPARLAFEHIVQYLHEGHGHGDHDAEGDHSRPDAGPMPDYFMKQIESGSREGFLYQKLREPRSYDSHKTRNKKYNEWLRMPQFSLDHEEREAVMTFVLGLIAAPPADKFVYKPTPRREAIVEGRKVLEKFNCGGCHLLETEQWRIAYEPEQFGEQVEIQTYPFLQPHFTAEELLASAQEDRRGMRHGLIAGMPTVTDNGQPLIYDDAGDPIEPDEQYDPRALEFPFELWSNVPLDGHAYQSGVLPLNIRSEQIEQRMPAQGGTLARYLLPYVVAREKQLNPAAKGTEAWGWLPPPLVGEGEKVQADWLHAFLINPYPIRPAVVLRMPKFNLSSDEATKLVNYFAAKDNAQYPYDYIDRRTGDYLAQANARYEGENRLQDAMRIVTDQNYCIKCHLVGDFEPQGRDIAKAPDLAMVYQRMRADYVRNWIANPKQFLPYTSMPVNVPYDPNTPNLGGVSQELYHGTSIEQLDGLVDLLMNFDEYAKERATIAPLVRQAAPSEPAAGEGEQPPLEQPGQARASGE